MFHSRRVATLFPDGSHICGWCSNPNVSVRLTNSNHHMFPSPEASSHREGYPNTRIPPDEFVYGCINIVVCSISQCPGNAPIAHCMICNRHSRRTTRFDDIKFDARFNLWLLNHCSDQTHIDNYQSLIDQPINPPDNLHLPPDLRISLSAMYNPALDPDEDSHNDFDPDDDDETVFSAGSVLVRSRFFSDIYSFEHIWGMTESMRIFYQREHAQRSSGLSRIVLDATGHHLAPATDLTSIELKSHLNLTLHLVTLTRTQVDHTGDLIESIKEYLTESPSSQDQRVMFLLNHAISEFQVVTASDPTLPGPLTTGQVSLLVQRMTKTLSTRFSISDLLASHSSSDRRSTTSRFSLTSPPMDRPSLFRTYLQGPTSIYRQLPRPEVMLTDDGKVAYLGLSQVVARFLASRFEPLDFPSQDQIRTAVANDRNKSVYESPAALAAIARLDQSTPSAHEDVIIFVYLWSDGAEKNNSRKKPSFHMTTVTFCAYRRNGDIRTHTTVISLSEKGSCLREFHSKLHDEFRHLQCRHLHYSGYRKRFFWGRLIVIASVRDRPERGDICGVGAHNHGFGKRVGYSAFIDKHNVDVLLPCDQCFASRRAYLRYAHVGGDIHRWSKLRLDSNRYCRKCIDLDYLRRDNPYRVPPGSMILARSLSPQSASPLSDMPEDLKDILDGTVIVFPLDHHQPLFSPMVRLVWQSGLPSISIPVDYKETFAYPTVYFGDDTTQPEQLEGIPPPPTPPHPLRGVGPNFASLRPMRVTYLTLLKAYLFALYNFHKKLWKMGRVDTYLKSWSINRSVIRSVFLVSDDNPNMSAHEVCEHAKRNCVCQLWLRTDIGHELSMELEAAYHCLVAGVFMNYLSCLETFFKSLKILPKVVAVFNGVLSNVKKMRMSTFQALLFGSEDEFKTTGWVGVHKIALLKLFPFAMSLVLTSDDPAIAGAIPQAHHFERMADFVLAAQCLNAIFSRCMCTSVSTATSFECRQYTKLFISLLDRLEQSMCISRSVLSTGNVLSMMNIPDQLQQFGSFRWFWDLLNEKAVQKVKSYDKNLNLSGGEWCRSKLELVTLRQTVAMTLGTPSGNLDDDDDDEDGNIRIGTPVPRRFSLFSIVVRGANDLLTLQSSPYNCIWDNVENYFALPQRISGSRDRNIEMTPLVIDDTPVVWSSHCPFFRYKPLCGLKYRVHEDNLLKSRFQSVIVLPRDPEHAMFLNDNQEVWFGQVATADPGFRGWVLPALP